MIIPPYLDPSRVSPGMAARPRAPFFIRPGDYHVIDGDTIRVLAARVPGAKRREEAFSIRLYTVNSPEKPYRTAGNKTLTSLGLNPLSSSPGERAKLRLREITTNRALLVEPQVNKTGQNRDRFGRLLANVAISGREGAHFTLNGAFAVGPFLLREGLAHMLKDIPLDPIIPDLVGQLQDHLRARSAGIGDPAP